jgi:multidrug efflux pump subunit AcrB
MSKKNTANISKVTKTSLFFYDKFKASMAIWMALFLFGFFSYTVFMQRQGFPNVNVPISVVQGVYFANNKNTVDTELTVPIVSAINDVELVKSTRATTTNNATTVVVEYNSDTSSADGSRAVEQKIESIRSTLPSESKVEFQPINAARFNNEYDILLSVTSPNTSVAELTDIAKQVSNDLKPLIPDATTIEVINPIENAVNPISGQTESKQTTFDWFGQRSNGSFQTQPSVVIGITTKDDQDILAFDKQVTNAIDLLSSRNAYSNVAINNAAGFAPSITTQISSLQKNLFEGLLIVAIVCLVFIGLRAGILASIGMLMTLSLTIGTLYIAGISLNTISLFGLVLCLGLIVDDTIIMIEAIDAQRKQKAPLREAIVTATKKVALASTAGTLTTILGFAPLLFISGILGEFIRILPITIIISLLISLIVSLFFIPFMSRWFLKSDIKQVRKNPLRIFRSATTLLGNTLSGIVLSTNTKRKKIARSAIAICISLIFIVGTGPLFGMLKFDIFPPSKDANELRVEFTFKPDTSLEQATTITKQANEKVVASLGDNVERITYLGTANNRSATANIDLKDYNERDETASQLTDTINSSIKSISDARIVISQSSNGPSKEQFPFKVQIASDDVEKANAAATNLVSFLKDREITRTNGTTTTVKDIDYTGEQAVITRKNGDRIVQVSANFNADDTTAIVQAAQKDVEDNFLNSKGNLAGINKNSVQFDFGSESDNQESFKSVLLALPILVILMFLLLAAQFKSITQPLLILIAVPFSFFGVATALLISNNPFSFFVMVAFFALIGISVNNSILLTDYANQARREGLSPRQAMASAIKERTRPLLTTSLTSILALLPLALTDPFWESLAVTLIGGLAASAILVLISFPYYYLILEAMRSRVSLKYRQRRTAK